VLGGTHWSPRFRREPSGEPEVVVDPGCSRGADRSICAGWCWSRTAPSRIYRAGDRGVRRPQRRSSRERRTAGVRIARPGKPHGCTWMCSGRFLWSRCPALSWTGQG